MRGLLGVTLAVVVSAGCAREPESGFSHIAPSNLGAAPVDVEDADDAVPASVSVRHVRSNKVLGAMAFQKVTGRTVDPDRLSGTK